MHPLAGSFNPRVLVKSCFSSDYSFEIHAIVKHLLPEKPYVFWIFHPEGGYSAMSFMSDRNGDSVNPQGGQDIIGGTASSSPISNGSYILGITKGLIDLKKPNFDTWLKLADEKYYTSFVIPCQNQVTINLVGIGKVPWGNHVAVSGRLKTKGHEPDASRVYQGKIINFIGTGPMPPVTTVDESGNFTSVFKVEDRIDGNQNVQATFEGDEHYAKSESNIVVYETVPHDTRLTIEIDPLRLALPGTKSQPQISLKPDEEFRISGLLLDASRNIPIPSKKIFFENNFDLNIFVVTDANGHYYVDRINAPERPESYTLKTYFEGDTKYLESKSPEIILAIEESFHDKNNENMRMPIDMHFTYTIDKTSIIQGLMLFHAFTYFESGFDEEKEIPQVISTIWLLSILGFNALPLGLTKRDGETVEYDGTMRNLSADMLCSTDQDSLVIDCTVAVPSSEKLDKILNTSLFLQKYSGKRFIPVIVTNKLAPNSIQKVSGNNVSIIDRTDIQNLLDLIMSNNIEQAKELFWNKVKRSYASGDS